MKKLSICLLIALCIFQTYSVFAAEAAQVAGIVPAEVGAAAEVPGPGPEGEDPEVAAHVEAGAEPAVPVVLQQEEPRRLLQELAVSVRNSRGRLNDRDRTPDNLVVHLNELEAGKAIFDEITALIWPYTNEDLKADLQPVQQFLRDAPAGHEGRRNAEVREGQIQEELRASQKSHKVANLFIAAMNILKAKIEAVQAKICALERDAGGDSAYVRRRKARLRNTAVEAIIQDEDEVLLNLERLTGIIEYATSGGDNFQPVFGADDDVRVSQKIKEGVPRALLAMAWNIFNRGNAGDGIVGNIVNFATPFNLEHFENVYAEFIVNTGDIECILYDFAGRTSNSPFMPYKWSTNLISEYTNIPADYLAELADPATPLHNSWILFGRKIGPFPFRGGVSSREIRFIEWFVEKNMEREDPAWALQRDQQQQVQPAAEGAAQPVQAEAVNVQEEPQTLLQRISRRVGGIWKSTKQRIGQAGTFFFENTIGKNDVKQLKKGIQRGRRSSDVLRVVHRAIKEHHLELFTDVLKSYLDSHHVAIRSTASWWTPWFRQRNPGQDHQRNPEQDHQIQVSHGIANRDFRNVLKNLIRRPALVNQPAQPAPDNRWRITRFFRGALNWGFRWGNRAEA